MVAHSRSTTKTPRMTAVAMSTWLSRKTPATRRAAVRECCGKTPRLQTERVREVAQVAVLWDGVIDTEPRRASILRQVGGAEDLVHERQTEVLVARHGVDGVVPVVPLGRVQDPAHTGETEPDVGVLEDG